MCTIVCIENRIPLFLVGKPGSSKSLSKAMVVDAMKGGSSHSDFFKNLKRVIKILIFVDFKYFIQSTMLSVTIC